MDVLIPLALSTLSLFGFYALLAVSLGIIFGQLGVVNVAHGEFVMVGAFIMYAFQSIPFVPRLFLAIILGLILGVITEKLVLSKLYARGFLITLLAMWGVAMVLRQGADAIFGSTPASVQAPVTSTVNILGHVYPTYRLVAAFVSLLIVAGLLLVIYRTKFGLMVRATVQNREMSSLLGISPQLMMTSSFAIAAALAVFAGAMQSPMLGVTPQVGASFLAPAFFAVLLARPGSLTGALFGSFVVALLTTVLRTYTSETASQFILFALLIVLIALRPNGLSWRKPQWLKNRKIQTPVIANA